MRNTKRIGAFVLAVCFLVIGAKFWRYILTNDSKSYTRIMMHQLHNPEKNIEVLFVGSSHVYRVFIPEMMDQIFGKHTFNAGSSEQRMDGSLAVIEEASRHNDIKQVYLELYYDVVDGGSYKDRDQMTPTYIISDYMEPSWNKLQYLLHASSKEHWINSFLIGRRNWKHFLDSEYVKDTIVAKQTTKYKNYEYPKKEGDIEYYVDQGFVANDAEVPECTYFNNKAYGNIGLWREITEDSDWYHSLKDIVEYCKKNGIELTLFITPEPEWTLVGKGDYQEYHDFIQKLADGFSVDFVDFNFLTNDVFDMNDRTLFKDEDHLNTKGAKEFSLLFGQCFNGERNVRDILYPSFKEKIADEHRVFYGIACKETNKKVQRNCRIISGADDYAFRVVQKMNDGTEAELKEWGESRDFILPAGEHGDLVIGCRNKLTGEVDEVSVKY